jgi:hypothetical protein
MFVTVVVLLHQAAMSQTLAAQRVNPGGSKSKPWRLKE